MVQYKLLSSQTNTYEAIKSENRDFTIKQALYKSLTEVLGDRSNIGEILAFEQHKGVKDETKKFLIKDARGREMAFALCSSPASSQLVAQGVERANLAKQAVGSDLGVHILGSLCEGKVDGLSYTIQSYCQPLSNSRLWWYGQRFLLSPSVLQWLARINKATVTKVHSDDIEGNFTVPLKHLAELEPISDRVRIGALQTLDRLANGKWSPRHVLMHGDLWKGNILLAHSPISNLENKSWTERFVIIDWAGSRVKGYGLYDLIRLAQSLNLRPRQLHEQVSTHCLILDCDFSDARCHLLSGLGYLSMNLGHFPLPRFVQLADSCLETLEKVER